MNPSLPCTFPWRSFIGGVVWRSQRGRDCGNDVLSDNLLHDQCRIRLGKFGSNPSFRPRFHLLGVFSDSCRWMLFGDDVDQPIGIEYLRSWSDQGFTFIYRVEPYKVLENMRGGLMALRDGHCWRTKLDEHRRNWRPHLLVFSDSVEDSLLNVQMANDLSVGRGIVTVVHLRGSFTQPPALEERSTLVQHMESFLQTHNIEAFCEVDMVRERTEGYISVAQANGIAGMQSNTIVMGWSPKLDIVPLLAMDSLQIVAVDPFEGMD